MLVFGIGYSLHHISISALSVIFFIIAFIAPTEKLTEEGHRVKPDEALLIKLTIIDGKIKKNNLYFFTKDFDIYEAYSVIAPIQIVSFNKSDNSFIGYFLYEHPQNYQHTNTEHEIYDSNMKCVAKIKISF